MGALRDYSVCLRSIITPLCAELWKLYNACAGYSRLRTPSEFYDLPALYVNAVNIIEAELQRIKDAGAVTDE